MLRFHPFSSLNGVNGVLNFLRKATSPGRCELWEPRGDFYNPTLSRGSDERHSGQMGHGELFAFLRETEQPVAHKVHFGNACSRRQ
jgi:hypothetical protein